MTDEPEPSRLRLPRGLTDDLFVLGPRAQSIRAYLRENVDRLIGSDPGGLQLRTTIRTVGGIALALALTVTFVEVTGAGQRAAGSAPAATLAGINHALLIVSVLVAGIIAMLIGLSVTDDTARGQLISTALLPVAMIIGLAIGLVLGEWHVLSLIWLVAVEAIAMYLRRFGPRWGAVGVIAFNGSFMGSFLHAQLPVSYLGWLAVDIVIGVIAALVMRLVIVRPDSVGTFRRMQRSWDARARTVLAHTIDAVDADDAHRDRARERLRRQVSRLNEATLIIDAQLPAIHPDTAAAEAHALFGAELALSNCARFAAALNTVAADAAIRRLARDGLAALLQADRANAERIAHELHQATAATERATVVCHRLGTSIADFAAVEHAIGPDPIAGDAATPVYTSVVQLNAGLLPGSAPLAADASNIPGRGGRLDRAALPLHIRSSIQITVASTIAIVLGNLISPARLYWAVLVCFLAFQATSNAGEQVRKALFRLSGTAIGIVVGDLLVHVTHAQIALSLLVVLVAMFLGVYLIRVNYTFMVIGITVMVSQLYAQLGELSFHLLLLRLAETAVGVLAVAMTVLVIVPLRPQRVLTAAVLQWFRSLRALLDASLDRLLEKQDTATLLTSVRQQDVAYAALEATAVALRSATFGRNSAQLAEIRTVSAAARNYARSLAAEAEAAGPISSPALETAAGRLRASADSIDRRIETGEQETYVRSAALVEITSRAVPTGNAAARLALRDLALFDGALARLARALGMPVEDLDADERSPVFVADDAGTQASTRE